MLYLNKDSTKTNCSTIASYRYGYHNYCYHSLSSFNRYLLDPRLSLTIGYSIIVVFNRSKTPF